MDGAANAVPVFQDKGSMYLNVGVLLLFSLATWPYIVLCDLYRSVSLVHPCQNISSSFVLRELWLGNVEGTFQSRPV
jgi:hypothetical protein